MVELVGWHVDCTKVLGFFDENPEIMDSVHKTMLTFPGDIVKVALGVCAGTIPAVFEKHI